jgi:hypothetical protein
LPPGLERHVVHPRLEGPAQTHTCLC